MIRVVSAHVYTMQGEPMCRRPRVTRHWRRLGEGAVRGCSCGRQWHLERLVESGGRSHWTWSRSDERPGGD